MDQHYLTQIPPIDYDCGRHVEKYAGHNSSKCDQLRHKWGVLNSKHKHREGQR
jgi:hypothetical protein